VTTSLKDLAKFDQRFQAGGRFLRRRPVRAAPAEAPLMQAGLDRLYAARYRTAEAVTVSSQDALLQTVSRTRATLTALLGGTAAISLLVGGIGVMNLMLITVAERTREIGIMRAVGAARDDVAALFLLEAVWLSAVGGVLGAGLGIAAAWAAPLVLRTPVSASWTAVAAGFAFSLVIGVAFGFCPARRAAALTPSEALRRE
jgi:putative ABC transport system permease protein